MNADDPAAGSDFEPLTEAELHALELRWYEGRMLRYAEWLGAFVQRHHAEILLAANGSREPAVLLAATKQVIAGRGSVHMAGEMNDQRNEIENELWYRGEKGDYDRDRIQEEWTAAHAAAWRRWRIKEYFFVTNQSRELVIAHLLAGGPLDADQ